MIIYILMIHIKAIYSGTYRLCFMAIRNNFERIIFRRKFKGFMFSSNLNIKYIRKYK